MSDMSLKDAYDLGSRTARALRVGDEFTGAMGACIAARLPLDGPHGWLFRSGFLDNLPGVVTDAGNRVVEVL